MAGITGSLDRRLERQIGSGVGKLRQFGESFPDELGDN
jgi:hypothetical protein